MGSLRRAVGTARGSLSAGVAGVRRRVPPLDHVIRAYVRYSANGGDRLAGSATYVAFLSFFPLVALAFAVAGFIVDAYPDVREELTKKIDEYLPGLADRLDVASIGSEKVGVGLVGLVVLVIAGVACIDALR
ncbi:MAG: YihY/virulence factor BrkB family protein, partial [Frankia sp.]|nr:YihY/virulence factor BrkB family protein [Frankia sp.]